LQGRPLVDKREQGFDTFTVDQREKYPAAFLAPFKDSCVSKNLEMSRHAWLALTEHLRQLADRQFHHAQQRHDAQPRWVGKRLESICKRQGQTHEIRI
jgi:hypothetical protein